MLILTRSRLFFAFIVSGLGIYSLLLAFGVLPADELELNAPMWVVGLLGSILILCSLLVLFANHGRFADLLAGTICLLFSIAGAWVSSAGSAEHFSGGIPFIPLRVNVFIARIVFFGGAVLCLVIAFIAFRRAARKSPE
ncbi:MAG: hypothetical protein AAF387_18020 [Pseudomonadota bacterium]